ncbi:MAG: hypothetical protein CFE45_26250 [Burkholderiales bacterium PBB5]|nr:MAG: hypothetical protein CFE45_26250 [Burkholderiales bacterium PBB5]
MGLWGFFGLCVGAEAAGTGAATGPMPATGGGLRRSAASWACRAWASCWAIAASRCVASRAWACWAGVRGSATGTGLPPGQGVSV